MTTGIIQAAEPAIRHRQRVVDGGGCRDAFEDSVQPADGFVEPFFTKRDFTESVVGERRKCLGDRLELLARECQPAKPQVHVGEVCCGFAM